MTDRRPRRPELDRSSATWPSTCSALPLGRARRLRALIWGVDGALRPFAMAIVVVNLLRSAARPVVGARRSSPTCSWWALLGGFAVRMAPRHPRRVRSCGTPAGSNMVASASCILVTHLGLLFWELRYVSASLAFPGLKPTADKEAVA